MQNGWIKLHRKIQDNPIYSDANMLKLWVHCLLKASHKERSQLVGNQMIELQPGEFVTGRESLSSEFNKGVKKSEVISPITLWRWLNNFEKWGMLNIKKTTKYSVVTVIGWSEHQLDEQQVNNKRTTDEQQVNTNKNVKNVNNDKNKDMDAGALAIFDYYISKRIIIHKSMTTSMKGKINTALKNYGMERLKKIIDNYHVVLRGSQYYFDTEYTLEKLLRPKDLAQFDDEAKPLYNFLKDKGKTKQNPSNVIKPSNSVDAGDLLEGMEWN